MPCANASVDVEGLLDSDMETTDDEDAAANTSAEEEEIMTLKAKVTAGGKLTKACSLRVGQSRSIPIKRSPCLY